IDTVLTYGAGHFYISQSDKGGLVFGGNIEGYNSYAARGNLPVVKEVISEGCSMFPNISRLKLLRMWGGIMDMSMDGSPIIDKTPTAGLYLNAGWCYGGFKATPGSGYCFAHTIAKDAPHDANAEHRFDRFRTGAVLDEGGKGPTPRLH
ncbi:MAG: FAD-dependent oxidoreductase, partial [Pseudomonadota bacterium]